jgi:hypothetical protein
MEQFIAEVEAYAAACGLRPGTVVQRAAGLGGSSWRKWQDGGSPTLRTVDQIRAYMAANPPPALATPSEDAA